ncbi:MAG: FHIPEP family type III secretion protein [Deltaproteobacteria bacterium]|nr:FHIPEP family type III secretion protein [Deltaproteobacteria bacterium]
MGQLGAWISGQRFSGWSLIALLLLVFLLLFPINVWFFDLLLAFCLFASLFFFALCFFSRDRQSLYMLPQGLMSLVLFRIVIEIAGCRLYLTGLGREENPFGQIVATIGNSLFGGDWIVAAAILLVIFVVNFVVVTKGVARIAEVLARFSLDAMPGKQLAIDADFRLGIINQEQAKERRNALAQESRFFGAMDGSMRLIQGDLALSVFLTGIILIAGNIISYRNDNELAQAAIGITLDSFSFGLFFSLTSLLIALGAANAISKNTEQEKGSHKDLLAFFARQKELMMVFGFLSILLGFSPWLPFWPFFVLGVAVLGFMVTQTAFNKRRNHKYKFVFDSYLSGSQKLMEATPVNQGPALFYEQSTELRPVILAISQDLIGDLDFNLDDLHNEFWSYFEKVRGEYFNKRGILLPLPQLIVGDSLAGGESAIFIHEQEKRVITLSLNQSFIEAAPELIANLQIPVARESKHPLTGRACCWAILNEAQRLACRQMNFNLLSGQEYLALELQASLLDSIEQFCGLDYVSKSIDSLRVEHAGLVGEILDKKVISLFELSELIRRLINEGLNVRDWKQILEVIARFYSLGEETEDRSVWLSSLHAFIRKQMLSSVLIECSENKKIRSFVLSSSLQKIMERALQNIDPWKESMLLEPLLERSLRLNLANLFEPVINRGILPITIVTEQQLRFPLQEYLADIYGYQIIRIICFTEIPNDYVLDTVAAILAEQNEIKGQ